MRQSPNAASHSRPQNSHPRPGSPAPPRSRTGLARPPPHARPAPLRATRAPSTLCAATRTRCRRDSATATAARAQAATSAEVGGSELVAHSPRT
eukprot:3591110-Pleurochrysis_carterae.AAC.3